LPLLASWPSCSITSGLRKKPTYPSTQKQLEDAPMFRGSNAVFR
jgi:hypothetical protein